MLVQSYSLLGANRHSVGCSLAAIQVLVCTGRFGSSSSLGGVREPRVQQHPQEPLPDLMLVFWPRHSRTCANSLLLLLSWMLEVA